MRGWAVVLVGAALSAQSRHSLPAVTGVLLELDSAPAGDLSVRVRDNHVYCFRFDAATTVERNGLPAGWMDLRQGDTVEVFPGPGPNPYLPRALSVRVVSEPPARRRDAATKADDPLLFDELFPRGNLTYAGVVARLGPERLTLDSRRHGRTEILLRRDTRFLFQGRSVAASALRVNARVFVRAARNLDGRIEAYQVVWGDILRPPPE